MSSTSKQGEFKVIEVRTGNLIASYDTEAKAKRKVAQMDKMMSGCARIES